MSKCLVTGAAGFIGSSLALKLRQAGHYVVGVDNFDPYYGRAIKQRNLIGACNFFIETDAANVETAVLREMEYVFHLAAVPGVGPSWEHFAGYVDENILTTEVLVRRLLNEGAALKRFILGSSSSVYGDYSGTTPEWTKRAPISPYGVTKAAQEMIVQAYASQRGFPAVACRFFTVYGPRQRPDMAFSIFIRKALAGEPITLYNAQSERDYTYIGDVTRGLIRCMDQGNQWAYNLCSGKPRKLADVISVLAGILGRQLDVIDRGQREGDPQGTHGYTLCAEQDLGWNAQVMLEEGLEMQVAWMREQDGLHDAL